MAQVEVILKNIRKSKIEEVFYDCLIIDVKNIISSHFYDKEKKEDIVYEDIVSLNNYFINSGTCNLYLKKAKIGIDLENVLILIACDELYGDITINFEEKQFEKYSLQEAKNKLKSMVLRLLEIYKSGKVEEISIGYEPADDYDMKVLEISHDCVKTFNEDIFESLLGLVFYSIAKELKG